MCRTGCTLTKYLYIWFDVSQSDLARLVVSISMSMLSFYLSIIVYGICLKDSFIFLYNLEQLFSVNLQMCLESCFQVKLLHIRDILSILENS